MNIVLYPIFLGVSDISTDVQFKNIFNELAYGKAPFGSYIMNKKVIDPISKEVDYSDYICSNIKGSEFIWKIENKDPNIIHSELIDIFINRMKIVSDTDKSKNIENFNIFNSNKNNCVETWGNINKKMIRNVYFDNYIQENTRKYNLTTVEAKYMYSLITISIMLKRISSKDIIFENGKITNIIGLSVDVNRPINDRIHLKYKQTVIQPEHRKPPPTLSTLWSKYLETLRTKSK
jgi:hypothetical protein